MAQIVPFFFTFLVNSMAVVHMWHSNLESSIGEVTVVVVTAASIGASTHAIAMRVLLR